MTPYTFPVVVGSVKPGRCRYCGRSIVWAIAVTKKGVKTLPFSKEPIFAPEVQDARGVKYQRWGRELLHLASCLKAPGRMGARP